MLLSIIKCGLLLLLAYIVWNALRPFFVRSLLHNIPGPPSDSYLVGNLARFHGPAVDSWDFHQSLEEDFNAVVRLHGLIGSVQLYVYDPVALHSIILKDQDLYEESPIFLSLSGLLFGKGILSTTGNEHRRHRKLLVQAFSTPNLRCMLPVLYEVANRVIILFTRLSDDIYQLDMNSILSRTSLEFIGCAGIGYSFDPLTSGEDRIDQYTESLKNLTPLIGKLAVFLPMLPLASTIGPACFRRFVLSLIPLRPLAALRNIVVVMDSKARALVREKTQAIQHDAIDNKMDIMSLLLKNNSTAGEEDTKFTDEEVVAQTSMIIQAATDTTSSALNRAVHLLALHPDVQEKLRAEIMQTKEQLDHDELVGLPYLDGFIREILRLYPPVPAMTRIATRDGVLPLSTPIRGLDGRSMDFIPVPKGTEVCIAIAAANHNKAIWGSDAREFRPERWEKGRAQGVTVRMSGVYGNTMTFVGGGRSCIGFKFVQLELKVVLSVFLRSFRFSVATDEIRWSIGSPASPSVNNRPLLPILVERLNS
ncbi:cytochrome P450 [Mycena galericulata]|nr:cytochrome P450 [Mycena galericulata]